MSNTTASSSTTINLQEYLQSKVPAWSNDDKCSALFSLFPAEVNAYTQQSIQERKSWWRELIVTCTSLGFMDDECADSGDRLGTGEKRSSRFSFATRGLPAKFKRKGAIPLCLEHVINEMKKDQTIVQESNYCSSQTWSSWFIQSSGALLLAPLSLLPSGFWSRSAISKEDRLIIPSLVEKSAQSFLAKVHSHDPHLPERLYSASQFQEKLATFLSPSVAETPFSNLDTSILLKYLCYKGHAITSERNGTTWVKIRASSEKKVSAWTEEEFGLLQMQMTLFKLRQQSESLSCRLEDYRKDAKRYLSAGQKSFALHALKQAKSLQALIDKRLASQFSLESILDRISHAETEASILDAYSAGTAALQRIMTVQGLTVERVEKTMDAVQDVLANEAEIDQALKDGNVAIATAAAGPEGLEAENAEMEMELDALLAEAKLQELGSLPSVPTAVLALPTASVPVIESKALADSSTSKQPLLA